MRENDEITGLFRSRLSGAEMTVRDGFWEELKGDLSRVETDATNTSAATKRSVLTPRFYRVAVLYLYWGLLLPLSGISLRKRKSRRPLHKWRP